MKWRRHTAPRRHRRASEKQAAFSAPPILGVLTTRPLPGHRSPGPKNKATRTTQNRVESVLGVSCNKSPLRHRGIRVAFRHHRSRRLGRLPRAHARAGLLHAARVRQRALVGPARSTDASSSNGGVAPRMTSESRSKQILPFRTLSRARPLRSPAAAPRRRLRSVSALRACGRSAGYGS